MAGAYGDFARGKWGEQQRVVTNARRGSKRERWGRYFCAAAERRGKPIHLTSNLPLAPKRVCLAHRQRLAPCHESPKKGEASDIHLHSLCIRWPCSVTGRKSKNGCELGQRTPRVVVVGARRRGSTRAELPRGESEDSGGATDPPIRQPVESLHANQAEPNGAVRATGPQSVSSRPPPLPKERGGREDTCVIAVQPGTTVPTGR